MLKYPIFLCDLFSEHFLDEQWLEKWGDHFDMSLQVGAMILVMKRAL